MNEKEIDIKNKKIENELNNPVYDVVEEAINQTSKKHKYKKTDTIKLLEALFEGDYGFLTSDDDYRMQVKVLDEYFQKTYNHHLITLELLKKIINNKNLKQDLLLSEKIFTKEKHSKEFLELLNKKEYEIIMDLIEKDKNLRYSIEVIYEKQKGSSENGENIL